MIEGTASFCSKLCRKQKYHLKERNSVNSEIDDCAVSNSGMN